MHGLDLQNSSVYFFVFLYNKCQLKKPNLFKKKNPTYVCRSRIPNMHRATFYHIMLCIFHVHFGAFRMVKLALKCKK